MNRGKGGEEFVFMGGDYIVGWVCLKLNVSSFRNWGTKLIKGFVVYI